MNKDGASEEKPSAVNDLDSVNIDRQLRWVRFCVHFIFGAVAGCFFGFFALARWLPKEWMQSKSGLPMGLVMGSSALAFGLVAGFFLDDFWEWLIERLER
jgi:hypothetical protein